MSRPPQIYLASASPRRAELLKQIGIAFERLHVDVPEVPEPGEGPEVYVLRLALAKARAGRMAAPSSIPVLGADTAVVVDGEPLGKPSGRQEALAMLARLSGRAHHVLTGVAMVGPDGREFSRLSASHVTFREVARDEMDAYWDTGEPADKAGAYGIQGRGAVFVSKLEGSYSGVVGLPLYETDELLRIFDISPADGWGE